MAKYQVMVKLYADVYLDAEDFNDAIKKAENYVAKEFYKGVNVPATKIDKIDWVDGETIGAFRTDA